MFNGIKTPFLNFANRVTGKFTQDNNNQTNRIFPQNQNPGSTSSLMPRGKGVSLRLRNQYKEDAQVSNFLKQNDPGTLRNVYQGFLAKYLNSNKPKARENAPTLATRKFSKEYGIPPPVANKVLQNVLHPQNGQVNNQPPATRQNSVLDSAGLNPNVTIRYNDTRNVTSTGSQNSIVKSAFVDSHEFNVPSAQAQNINQHPPVASQKNPTSPKNSYKQTSDVMISDETTGLREEKNTSQPPEATRRTSGSQPQGSLTGPHVDKLHDLYCDMLAARKKQYADAVKNDPMNAEKVYEEDIAVETKIAFMEKYPGIKTKDVKKALADIIKKHNDRAENAPEDRYARDLANPDGSRTPFSLGAGAGRSMYVESKYTSFDDDAREAPSKQTTAPEVTHNKPIENRAPKTPVTPYITSPEYTSVTLSSQDTAIAKEIYTKQCADHPDDPETARVNAEKDLTKKFPHLSGFQAWRVISEFRDGTAP